VNRAIVVAFSLSGILAFSSCTNGSMGGMMPQNAPMTAQDQSLPADALIGPDSGDVPFQSANPVVRLCPAVAGQMACLALLRTDVQPPLDPAQLVGSDAEKCPFQKPIPGYCANNLQDAYKLPSLTAGKDKVVAIVDAFGYKHVASDLDMYRSTMGLPACKTSDKCFRVLNQDGKSSPLPPQGSGSNSGWLGEESLDVDMVSAICPHCKIVLIQTNSNYTTDLYAGEKTAEKLAKFVSNSWGGGPEGSDDPIFHKPGTVITAAAGDCGGGYTASCGGGGPQQPCSYTYVVCVGGTHLIRAHNARGWDETVWNDWTYDECGGPCGATGSGCSIKIAKPAWQTDKGCKMRSEADVSATAAVSAPVIVYNSELVGASGACTPPNCFWLFGGTSVSTPIITSVFALADNPAAQNGAEGIWKHHDDLYNVTMGNNLNKALGVKCASKISYICHARVGFSGPVGWGTPHGISAF
jgi:hypothetical protein